MSELTRQAQSMKPGVAGSLVRGVWPVLAGVAFAVLMQLWVRPNIDAYPAKLLLDIGVNVVLAVSLNMVNGFTGQFSIGHAGFLAAGGYAAAIVTYYLSIRWWGSPDARGGVLSGMLGGEGLAWFTSGDALFMASLLVGGVVAAVLGVVVGLPSLRLRGDYLAIVTLGFGEIVRVSIQQTSEKLVPFVLSDPASPLNGKLVYEWTVQGKDEKPEIVRRAVEDASLLELAPHAGGSLGFSGIPTYTSLFWVYLAVAVTVLVAFRLKTSTFGRAFLSIREDEVAAEAMGVNTTRYKVWAFVLAAFFAGIAGGLFAHTLGVGLSAESAGFMKSFDVIIMVVLGGLGSISGAALAAVVVTLLPEAFRDPLGFVKTPWGWGVVGVMVVVALAGLVARWRQGKALGAAVAARAAIFGVVGLGLWGASRGLDLGQYRMIVYALALILMMIFRPQGLLGVHEVWDGAVWSWLKGGRMSRGGAKT